MLKFLTTEGRRFGKTVVWSLDGWRAAWASEKTLRQWTIVHALSVFLAIWLPLASSDRTLIISLGFILLATELLNTGIEATVDLISPDQHPLAKKAKDCSSAGVALVGLACLAAWISALSG